MERLWYLLIALSALIVAVIFIILSITKLPVFSRSRNKWIIEFWIAVAILMSLIYSISYYRNTTALDRSKEWNIIVKSFDKIIACIIDRNVAREEQEQIRDASAQGIENLNQLVAAGLISSAVADLIKDRFEELTYQRLDISCYVPAPCPPGPRMRSFERLKYRLPLLHKALAEGKINQWIYDKVILGIKQDLEIIEASDEKMLEYYNKVYINTESFPVSERLKREKIEDEAYKEDRKIKDDDIQATKAKTRELIDRAEKSIQK